VANWLILEHEYGQLGNRLHTHANALAWCIENKVNLLNLGFLSSSALFAQQGKKPIHIFLSYRSCLNQIFLKTKKDSFIHRLARSNKYLSRIRRWVEVIAIPEDKASHENDLKEYFSKNQNKQILLLRAWDIRCTDALIKHQKQIREILTPNACFRKLAENRVAKLKNKFAIIVGIHARRGDYKQYLEGIHFHGWSRYKEWIIQAKKLFEKTQGMTVGFLLCSDESPPLKIFEGLPVTSFRNTEAIVDLHTLSLCDYNFGPPSSFGTWLSFHGRVPRLTVTDKTEILSISQFSYSKSC
jgi:hypothetical protein